MPARITTVIPVYNGERYLAATLDSLRRQVLRPDRVVLINDGSTDGTVALARTFRDLPVEVRDNPRNLGLFPTHNRALELAAESEYLHILHANDLVRPDCYRALSACLESAPAGSMSYCDHAFIHDDGTPLSPLPPDDAPSPAARPVGRRAFLGAQAELKSLQLHSVLLKTGCRPSPVSFPLDYPQLGDVIFHAEWAVRAPEIRHVPAVLSLMRRHPGSASLRNARNLQAFVLDEWRGMTGVAALIDEPAAARWLRRQRLACLFSARTEVKLQMFRDAAPEYAREIDAAADARVSPLHRMAGRAAVFLRDRLQPGARPAAPA